LREDWRNVQATAEIKRASGDLKGAATEVKAFHDKLCETRVLDPACGTGNFLYVSLELMKRLEGEVLEALLDLGGQEALRGLGSHSVDPHQFHGLEINPRAAAIAELVLWIGYLQWHFRTKGGSPEEPILRAFKNIQVKNAVLTWDGEPDPIIVEGKETYPNARRPEWPMAEFIVGNPPFIGGKDIRARLRPGEAEALWAANSLMNESADFVMYWWDRAAELLTRKGTALRRFGLVTTNSISQVFQRKVMERHLNAKKTIKLALAIPDHPWTKATDDAAAVRIAMTVGEAGSGDGILRRVTNESALDTDIPVIAFADDHGVIHSNLTIGVNVIQCKPMQANVGLSSRGMMLFGAGFIITPQQAVHLGLGRREGLERFVRDYRNGRDLTLRPRGVKVIDLYGLKPEDVRQRFPEIYQHILTAVKPERDTNRDKDIRSRWWLFGRTRDEIRPALVGLTRYVATVETAKHRVFQFLNASLLPDNKLLIIALDDAFQLGVLSSDIHLSWVSARGALLEDRPVYVKSECFDPFPFPDANNIQKQTTRVIAEELDSHRKRVLAEHPHLTLTGLYNLLEKLRAGIKPDDLNEDDRRIFDDGLVLIMKELHDRLDAAVADAYGWPLGLSDEEILVRLVALNKERSAEEKRGLFRWLRPDYQIPRFAKGMDKQAATEEGAQVAAEFIDEVEQKPSFPAGAVEQTAAVFAALSNAVGPLDPKGLAAQFKRTRTTEKKVGYVLASLARLGYVTSGDGKSFSLRRVA
jgi:hypothetical protein